MDAARKALQNKKNRKKLKIPKSKCRKRIGRKRNKSLKKIANTLASFVEKNLETFTSSGSTRADCFGNPFDVEKKYTEEQKERFIKILNITGQLDKFQQLTNRFRETESLDEKKKIRKALVWKTKKIQRRCYRTINPDGQGNVQSLRNLTGSSEDEDDSNDNRSGHGSGRGRSSTNTSKRSVKDKDASNDTESDDDAPYSPWFPTKLSKVKNYLDDNRSGRGRSPPHTSKRSRQDEDALNDTEPDNDAPYSPWFPTKSSKDKDDLNDNRSGRGLSPPHTSKRSRQDEDALNDTESDNDLPYSPWFPTKLSEDEDDLKDNRSGCGRSSAHTSKRSRQDEDALNDTESDNDAPYSPWFPTKLSKDKFDSKYNRSGRGRSSPHTSKRSRQDKNASNDTKSDSDSPYLPYFPTKSSKDKDDSKDIRSGRERSSAHTSKRSEMKRKRASVMASLFIHHH